RQKQLIAERASNSVDANSPWNNAHSWRMNQAAQHNFDIQFGEEIVAVTATALSSAPNASFVIRSGDLESTVNGQLQDRVLFADIDGHRQNASVSEHDSGYSLYNAERAIHFNIKRPDLGDNSDDAAENQLVAPMNGTVVSHLVAVGSTVSKGDPLMIMEAMKMEHTIRAPSDGTVAAFFYQPGELVSGGAELIQLEKAE
ncbi:acetyl-CoA carboxylase biotin carboxyl carrier protein subunit, partial [Zhongshania sp.]